MERVIVTVRLAHETRGRDLEVPAAVEAARLAELIADALQGGKPPAGQHTRYEIWADPPGRILRPGESLADAGAWDGAWLVLQPIGDGALGAAPTPGATTSPPAGGPVAGWQPLGIDLPAPSTTESPADEQAKPPSGYVWKRLD
jgi:hypothetical protein